MNFSSSFRFVSFRFGSGTGTVGGLLFGMGFVRGRVDRVCENREGVPRGLIRIFEMAEIWLLALGIHTR